MGISLFYTYILKSKWKYPLKWALFTLSNKHIFSMKISLFSNQLSPCIPITDSQTNKSFSVMIYSFEAILRLRGKIRFFQNRYLLIGIIVMIPLDNQYSFILNEYRISWSAISFWVFDSWIHINIPLFLRNIEVKQSFWLRGRKIFLDLSLN